MLKIPLFNLGFRPFFLFAGLYSIFSMLVWALVYSTQIKVSFSNISIYQWHAHEMIYGYSLAVIAGFLLTAVKNWTSIQTINGLPLFLLVCLWITARLFLFLGEILTAGLFDLLFMLSLFLAIIYPIIKSKKWNHLVVSLKLLLLFIGNMLFYLGAIGLVNNGMILGIYSGFYLIIGLILIMGKKLFPFFISKSIESQITLLNSVWINRANLLFFLVFFLSELILNNQIISTYTALILFLINAVQLIGWHTTGIWDRPLLWILYLSLWSICLGFLLFAGNYWFNINKFIAIHSFAYGGIGAITLGMMSRVSIGHTGRDITKPPKLMNIAFITIIAGTSVRVVFPLFIPQLYNTWIFSSQVLWIIAFGIFTVSCAPMLLTARIDGKFG